MSGPGAILVVDDNPANLRLLTDMLGREGYGVRVAGDGPQALRSVSRRPTDLILMDVRMPGMDGLEVCRRLKAEPATREVPVIFLSALGEVEDKLRGFEAGGVDYITKPFAPEEVLARVHTHMSLSRLQRELEASNEALREQVAQRERAESSLSDTEARLSVLFESAGDALYVVDSDARIVDANPTACRELGYAREELRALTVPDIDPDFATREEEHALWEHRNESRSVTFEAVHRRKDGSRFPVEISLSSVGAGEGGRILFAVVRNIEQRKQAEQSLQRAREAAEEASRAKSVFLANMSHELRTPLNAVLGFAQLLQRDRSLSEDQRATAATIQRSGEHLLALINDVLEISKIEAERMRLEPATFELPEVLQVIEDMVRLKAEQKGIALRFDCAPDLPRFVHGDQRKLKQILLNLLGNAVKFTDHGGVELTASPAVAENAVDFVVRDSGIGIPARDRERVFDAFYQSATAVERGEGTGLGLAISRRYARLMGGDIEVTEAPGGGSEMHVRVQLPEVSAEALAERQRVHDIAGLAPGQRAFRVLVVEDKPDSRELLVRLLSDVGFTVREAANGAEAVAVSREWQPHLVWMDMRMPVMDGYQATRQIKAGDDAARPVVIALTASAFEEDRSAVLAAGCDDFLRKPVSADEVYTAMQRHLGVEYVYVSPPGEEEGAAAAGDDAATAERVAALPPALAAELRQAALMLDVRATQEAIHRVAEVDRPLAAELERLAAGFRYDEIQTLCQT